MTGMPCLANRDALSLRPVAPCVPSQTNHHRTFDWKYYGPSVGPGPGRRPMEVTHLKKIKKKLAKQLRVLRKKFDIQTAVLKGKEDLLKGKDDLLKGKDNLLHEKALSQSLAAAIIEDKKAEIKALKMDLLQAKGLLSAKGIFERILQLIHEETLNLRGKFNATLVCANLALHTSDGIFFSIIELRRK